MEGEPRISSKEGKSDPFAPVYSLRAIHEILANQRVTTRRNMDSKMRHVAYQALAAVLTRRHFLKRWWHTVVLSWSVGWMTYALLLTVLTADPDSPIEFFRRGYKFKECFICLWMSIVQLVYYSLYSTIDYMELYEKNKTRLVKWTNILHQAASCIFFSLIFPLSLAILVFFWGIYFYNRENIYPVYMEALFPMWLNHALHTVPFPLAVLYMIFSNKTEPSKLVTCSSFVAFLSVYAYVFFAARFREGVWVYVMLDGLDDTTVICLYVFACAVAGVLLFLGHKLYRSVSDMRERVFVTLSAAAAAAS